MSTSADPAGRCSGFELVAAHLSDPPAQALIADVQAEYVVRYGSPDRGPLDAADFEPPAGLFLLGRLDGDLVACGGWRTHPSGPGGVRAAEIKRMYVSLRARRRGLAVRVLSELERTASAAGFGRIVLETGLAQPEALTLYTECGYRPIEPFGFYRDAPLAVHLARRLDPADVGP